MVKGRNNEKFIVNDSVRENIKDIFSQTYSTSVVISNLINFLDRDNMYINRIFLNILVIITLVEKIFQEIMTLQ